MKTPANSNTLFDEFMDEIHGEVVICGQTFDAYRVLKQIDPESYRQRYLDWCDDMGYDDDADEVEDDEVEADEMIDSYDYDKYN